MPAAGFKKACLRAIKWYSRKISPLFPARCKYYPTCSMYAFIAIQRFGVIRGSVLALLRLFRCRPWSSGGIDDVPQTFSVFYRFKWSKAHEEATLKPVITENRLCADLTREEPLPRE